MASTDLSTFDLLCGVAQRLFTLSLILSLTRAIMYIIVQTSHSSSMYITIVLWVSLTPLRKIKLDIYGWRVIVARVFFTLSLRSRTNHSRARITHFAHLYRNVLYLKCQRQLMCVPQLSYVGLASPVYFALEIIGLKPL